jgi:hypothetical protein
MLLVPVEAGKNIKSVAVCDIIGFNYFDCTLYKVGYQ